LHIGWIGGVEGSETMLRRAAEREGHTFELHAGKMRGRGGDGLDRVIARCDVLVIVLDVNSHQAVWRAREVARKIGTPTVFVRRPSLAVLQRVMREHAAAATPALTSRLA
jgi:hypothetical protein